MKRYVVALTGASGPVLGVRLIRELVKKAEVYALVSSQTFSILKSEAGIDLGARDEAAIQKKMRKFFGSEKVHYFHELNFYAPVASGSFRTDGMFVVPCSMKTLAAIACGYSNSLIERAADVIIKEGRPLVLSPREMPFSAIHLENMLKLARIGVRIAPPVAGFYHKPQDLDDLIDFWVGKILDAMGVEHRIYKRWGGS